MEPSGPVMGLLYLFYLYIYSSVYYFRDIKYLLLQTDNGQARRICKQVFRTEETQTHLNVLQYTQSVTMKLVSEIRQFVPVSNK